MRPRAGFGTWIDYFRNVLAEGLGCDVSANSWRHGIAWQSLHDVPPESDWFTALPVVFPMEVETKQEIPRIFASSSNSWFPLGRSAQGWVELRQREAGRGPQGAAGFPTEQPRESPGESPPRLKMEERKLGVNERQR